MIRYLITIIFLLTCTLSYADVYVVYKTDTNEVVSVQDDDSAVVEEGYTKKVIKGKTKDQYPLDYSPLFYKFKDNKFIVDVKKISDKENQEIINEEIIMEKKLIDEKLKDMAIDELKKDGITLKHMKKSNE